MNLSSLRNPRLQYKNGKNESSNKEELQNPLYLQSFFRGSKRPFQISSLLFQEKWASTGGSPAIFSYLDKM